MLVNKFLRSELLSTPQSKNIISKLISYLGEEAIFGAGVVFVLLFSTATEALGFHFIIGAFFGGLLLNKDIIGMGAFESMTKTLNSITDQFLTPYFLPPLAFTFLWKLLINPPFFFLLWEWLTPLKLQALD